MRRLVASAVTPDIFKVLQQNYQVVQQCNKDDCHFTDVQAGLEDFSYMENMTSVAQLKEQITVTGAEVKSLSLSTKYD